MNNSFVNILFPKIFHKKETVDKFKYSFKFSLPFNSFNDASLKFKYAFPPSLYFNIALLITISALFFTALNSIVL